MQGLGTLKQEARTKQLKANLHKETQGRTVGRTGQRNASNGIRWCGQVPHLHEMCSIFLIDKVLFRAPRHSSLKHAHSRTLKTVKRFRCFVAYRTNCKSKADSSAPRRSAFRLAISRVCALGGHLSGKRETESARRTTHLQEAGPENSVGKAEGSGPPFGKALRQRGRQVRRILES